MPLQWYHPQDFVFQDAWILNQLLTLGGQWFPLRSSLMMLRDGNTTALSWCNPCHWIQFAIKMSTRDIHPDLVTLNFIIACEKAQDLKCTIRIWNSAYQIYDNGKNPKSWNLSERSITRNLKWSLLKATIAYRFCCSASCMVWPHDLCGRKNHALEFGCHRFLIHGEFEYSQADDKGRFVNNKTNWRKYKLQIIEWSWSVKWLKSR